jgi:3-oxoacyl-ACP reductase-like protein
VTIDIPIATTPAAPATASTPVTVYTPSSGPVARLEDVPIKTILLVLVAQKLKKRVDEISLSESIKDLVGGKSTLRNEIFSAIFSKSLQNGEELPLEELGSAFAGSGFSGALASLTRSHRDGASGRVCQAGRRRRSVVNTVRALFLVSLEAKCLAVSICRLSRATVTSARAGSIKLPLSNSASYDTYLFT